MLLLFHLVTDQAEASCGSTSCPIDLHALRGAESGQFSLDLSFQYIDQDQPRIGTRRANVGELKSDHDEIRTINRLASLQLGYAVSDRLQLGLTLPWVSRSHEHFDRETSKIEWWNFSDPGDAVLQVRLRVAAFEPQTRSSLWLSGGVKFATGTTHEKGSSGENAEVTIAPGTGSTDGLLGITWESAVLRDTTLEGMVGHTTLIPFFVSLNGRINGRGTRGYQRGHEFQFNAGTEYPITVRINLVGQLNARWLGKDNVGETGENPDFTGSESLYLSPGLHVALGHDTSLYGFVQVPLYQHVNGLQLTSSANYLAGIHKTF